jgi:hypothetical protein
MIGGQAAPTSAGAAARRLSVAQLLTAIACVIAGYWLMAFATGREWLFVPSIVVQGLAAGLCIWALQRGQRRWPWLAVLVAEGVVALLTVIDLFFAALFSWGA